MKKKTSKFAEAIGASIHQQKTQGSKYGYLSLPRGVNMWKETPDTRVKLDFLPYVVTDPNHPEKNVGAEVGEVWYRRLYRAHRSIGANNESFVCPSSIGKPCPICIFRAKRLRESAPQEETGALRAKERNLYVVIPREQKDFEEKPHIWDVSQFCFQEALADELEENPQYRPFPDLDEGYTLKVRFSEEAMGKNKYAKTSRIDFEKRDPLDETIMKQVPSLDEVLIILSFKELEAKFLELDDSAQPKEAAPAIEEEAPFEEDRSARKKPKVEKEEEEEEEEEEVEEVKPPARTRTAKTAKPKVEADDDDDDEKPAVTGKTAERCPFKHKFGVDCEKFDDCDDCPLWDECFEAKNIASKGA